MKLSGKAKKAGVLIGIMMIMVVGTVGAYSMGLFEKPEPIIQPKPSYPIDHLSIDASFLLKTGETNESVNVSCDLFMTNIWEKESGEIKATAYVSEQSTNLAVFKNTVEFGVIDANSTKELNIPVKFSGSSYKVEILLFESNKLFKKITLSMTVYQNFYIDSYGATKLCEGRTLAHVQADGQWSIVNDKIDIKSIQ